MIDTVKAIADTLGAAVVDSVQSAVPVAAPVAAAVTEVARQVSPLLGRPGLGEIVKFQATGFVVVMLALSGMAIMSWLLGQIIAKVFGPYKPAPSKIPMAAPAAVAPVAAAVAPTANLTIPGPMLQPSMPLATDATSEELVLVITSAVAHALGVPPADVRILEIAHQGQAWRLNGRFNLHSSHQPR